MVLRFRALRDSLREAKEELATIRQTRELYRSWGLADTEVQ